MLDYQTINDTLITIESSTNPDTMDLAGVPSVRDESEKKAGLFSKFLKNINKSRKKLSENLEKSKQNLSKNVGKSKENLEKNLDVSKKNLSKNIAKTKEKLGLNEPEPKGEVNKAALGKLSLGQPAKYDVKEELNLPKAGGKVNKELLNKATSNALGKYDFGKPNVKENLNLPKPKTTEEHKEAAQGHLQKLLSKVEHPAAAGALGALAAGAGILGARKLLRKKKQTA